MSGSKVGLSAPRRRTPQSELAKAVRMMGAAAGQDAGKGLFGQSVSVAIGATTLSSDAGYDIHFEIPFDSDTEVNESTVTIFNLSVSTLARLQVGSPVKITAGYKRDSVGEVLSGKIKAVRSYWDGLDYVTELTVTDYRGAADQELQDIAFGANTSATVILKDLISRLGIPVATFQPARDYVFASPIKITGSLMDAISKMASACGVKAWICKSAVYVCPIESAISEGYFDLGSESGLLSVEPWSEIKDVRLTKNSLSVGSGSGESDGTKSATISEDKPEESGEAPQDESAAAFTDAVFGISAKMLFQHRIYTGCTVQISSRAISGRFKVLEGEHTKDDDQMITEIKAIRVEG